MKQENYVKAIVSRLQCSGSRKREIRRELEADIESAMENGESWEQVERRMGTPSAVASEFNSNFPDTERKAAKRSRRIRIILIIAVVLLAAVALVWRLLPKSYPIGTHSDFEEQTVIDAAEKVVNLLDADDFEMLKAMSTDSMYKFMDEKTWNEARAQVGENWGAFQSFGSVYTAEIRESGGFYAVVQLVAVYENKAVTYTISFNEKMELSGLYIK